VNNPLVDYAIKVQGLGFHPVPIAAGTEKKPPSWFCWTDLRDGKRPALSEQEIETIFSNPEVGRVALILNNRSLVIDYDGDLGKYTLWNEIMPRCSKELRRILTSTTHTKTPHGGHILVLLDATAFPDGIDEMLCWQLSGNGYATNNSNGNGHAEVRILSQNKYSIEYGQDYQPIIDIQQIVTLSKEFSIELVEKCRHFKLESIAIRNVASSLLPYWVKERRQDLALAIPGYLYKNNVDVDAARHLIQYLTQVTNDEEAAKRLDAVNSTYSKNAKEVSGYTRLTELIDENELIIQKIEHQFSTIGYSFYNGNGHTNKKLIHKTEDDEDKSVKLSAEVIKLLEPIIEKLFKNKTDDKGFAAIYINGHREIVPIYKSKRFDLWVRKTYFDETEDTLGSDILKEVVDTLESKASFDGDIIDLQLRVCKLDDRNDKSTYYYDLTNKIWQVVKITEKGWSIKESVNVPIMFVRYRNQIAQVLPSKEYPSDILDKFMSIINVKDEDSKLILKCYLISLFVPGIPKPVLMLHGEQGAAKTALEELIRSVVDPSSAPTLVFPRTIEELIQQLSHNYLAYYDNVSNISDWVSNQLCRAVTGSGFSKRELYTDDNDIIYNFRRAIGFNGVNLAASKADLLDRGIIVELERIPENKRLKDEDVKAKLDAIKSQLLGFIFDKIVEVIKIQNNGGIRLDSRARMADFEEYAEIISRVIGHEPNKFIEAYRRNRRIQTDVVIEGSPVAAAIIKLLGEPNYKEYGWSGSTTDLLTEFELYADRFKINIKSRSWPKSPNSLSFRLNQVKTNLREFGIEISYTKDIATRVKKWKIIRSVKDRSDRYDRSEEENHAQNEPENANDVSNAHSDASEKSFGKNTENHVQNQGCERSNDVNDVIRISSGNRVDIYRIGNTDTFGCMSCKLKGDKWFMQEHSCNGNLK
jgi:hypothetical protein